MIKILRRSTWLILLPLTLVTLTTSTLAFMNGTCDPVKDFCITLITDKSVPAQSTIQYNATYHVGSIHTQLPENSDQVNPSNNYIMLTLPVDLLTRAQIKNIQFNLFEVNQVAVANCSVKTPLDKKILGGSLKLRLFYNPQTNLYNCKTSL